jgi:hypothetical protein
LTSAGEPAGKPAPGDQWEAAGRAAAAKTEGRSVILLAGSDPSSTARAAIGLARALQEKRDVSVVDTWGELRELEALAGTEDTHGVADYIEFGVSWSRLRTPVPGTPSLSVVKSGTDEIAQESLLTAGRWDSLFSRYRSGDSLLILVGRLGSPGLGHLAARADAVLIAGDGAADALPNLKGTIHPLPVASTPAAGEAPVWSMVQRWPMLVVLTIVIAGLVALFVGVPVFRGAFSVSAGRDAITAAGEPAAGAVNFDSLPILNPEDAASASAYSVDIALLNTRAGAQIRLADLSGVAGSTIVPLASVTGDVWYRVVAGAVPTKSEADSLQMALRATGVEIAEGDRVVLLPLALRVAIYAPTSEAAAEAGLARYTSLGVPAYFLAQSDGSLVIYAGAFERAGQAAHLAREMASLGIPPRLEYRKGR